jgi:hypothetical protein
MMSEVSKGEISFEIMDVEIMDDSRAAVIERRSNIRLN